LEAIVLSEWLRALRDFEVVKKRWTHALLSIKCCCFVRKPAWEVDAAVS